MGADEPETQGSPLDDVQKSVTEQFQNLSNLLENGVDNASDMLRSTTATAKDEAEKAVGVAQHWYTACISGLKQADEALISTLKSGILLARENETTATIAGVGLVAVILPGTRRLLWRMTLGRLQSAEAAQKSAELRVQSLATRLTEHDGEVQKLSERLALARQEYERGLSKLQGAASELRSLSSRVEGTERKAKALMADLRDLRSKHALQLRSDVAVMAKQASKQHVALEKQIVGLAQDGF